MLDLNSKSLLLTTSTSSDFCEDSMMGSKLLLSKSSEFYSSFCPLLDFLLFLPFLLCFLVCFFPVFAVLSVLLGLLCLPDLLGLLDFPLFFLYFVCFAFYDCVNFLAFFSRFISYNSVIFLRYCPTWGIKRHLFFCKEFIFDMFVCFPPF